MNEKAAYVLHTPSSLPTGAWDVISFLNNSKSFVTVAGGALIMLLGTVCLVWGAVQLCKKIWGSGQAAQQITWVTVVALLICGGALSTGGWSLISKIGSGGQTTIEQLGTGSGSILIHGD